MLIGVTRLEQNGGFESTHILTLPRRNTLAMLKYTNESTCYSTIDLNNKGIKFIYLCACFPQAPYMMCIMAKGRERRKSL